MIENYPVTWANLCKHVDKFGLDRDGKGYNAGKVKRYKSYKQFRTDAAVEVARQHFAEDTFAQFVEKYGEHGWVDSARADHAAVREAV